MKETELKPCPFCGSKAQRLTNMPFYNLPQYRGRRAILCTHCGVIMLGRDEEAAVELWNRRADDGRKEAN
jgi:Lar family restriction alleviation protein